MKTLVRPRLISRPNQIIARQQILPPAPKPQAAPYMPQSIQEEIILKRGGRIIVNQGFDQTESAAVTLGTSPIVLLTFTVPQGSDQSLLITHFGNDVSDLAAWSFITWNMYIDNVPVKSYYGIVDQLGTTNQMRKVSVDIIVNGGQTIKVEAVSTTATSYNALVSLQGVFGTYDYQKG